MTLPANPQAQLAQLLELNKDITTATEDVATKNLTALEAAAAADDAQLHLTALNESRDELLEAMKTTGRTEDAEVAP